MVLNLSRDLQGAGSCNLDKLLDSLIEPGNDNTKGANSGSPQGNCASRIVINPKLFGISCMYNESKIGRFLMVHLL